MQNTPSSTPASSSASRFFFIPALQAPTIASALACCNKLLKFLGVVVEKSRGGVRGFFHVGLDVPNHKVSPDKGRKGDFGLVFRPPVRTYFGSRFFRSGLVILSLVRKHGFIRSRWRLWFTSWSRKGPVYTNTMPVVVRTVAIVDEGGSRVVAPSLPF